MSSGARYLVAKYISDLQRMEPRNVGIVLWASGKVSARFLGERADDLGKVDGRTVPGFIASTAAYKQWVEFWRAQLGNQTSSRFSESGLNSLKDASRGNFLLVDGGLILEEISPSYLPKLTNDLFQRLVDTTSSEDPKDPILEQIANNWIKELGLTRNEHFRSRYEVVCPITPKVEERFEFSHAYTANGIQKLYQRVPLTRRYSHLRRTVHDSAWMFEKVIQQGIVRRDQAVALVYATDELMRDPEISRSFNVLSSVASVANLADQSQAFEAFNIQGLLKLESLNSKTPKESKVDSTKAGDLFHQNSLKTFFNTTKGETRMSKHCNDGLDGRCRDNDGEIRHKRRDTEVGTLRKTYGDDFASGFRSDAHLGTVLENAGVDTLSEYLKKQGK
jgi:hypothetical protein